MRVSKRANCLSPQTEKFIELDWLQLARSCREMERRNIRQSRQTFANITESRECWRPNVTFMYEKALKCKLIERPHTANEQRQPRDLLMGVVWLKNWLKFHLVTEVGCSAEVSTIQRRRFGGRRDYETVVGYMSRDKSRTPASQELANCSCI